MFAWSPTLSRRTEILLVSTLILIALALRIAAHDIAPNGWRDDELSSALVVTGHVLEGDFRVYYPDASGHEGLYEYFQAGTLLLFGRNEWGIRAPSVLFGVLAVLLTYLLTRRLFDWPAASIAAFALAVSFWSLMYSRTGQRHISVTVTTLLAFHFLWGGIPQATQQSQVPLTRLYLNFALAGVFMGLGFYTYFASRGVPLIVIAWAVYLLLWQRDWGRHLWPGLVLMVILALLMSVPLVLTLRVQPEAETRVAEIARPLHDALSGDFSTVGRYTLTTLGMFTHEGDEEWLYNIPHRPIFGILGGVLFWGGVGIALVRAFGRARDPRMAFLLLWLAAGLAPGTLSVPAASLGHTILAQPVTMVFPAVALMESGPWLTERRIGRHRLTAITVLSLTVLFLSWEVMRGVYDYFALWPDDPYNRVLHHSDLHEAAAWLNNHAETHNVAIGSLLLERWDQQVMKLDLDSTGWQVRAFNPDSAYILIPGGGIAILPEYLADGWGASYLGSLLSTDQPYAIHQIDSPDREATGGTFAEFDNGLILARADIEHPGSSLVFLTTWRVDRPLDLPGFPLLSKPPAPGDDDRPRLAIFIQLIDSSGQRAAGYDGLGVDPYTLAVGDVFVQRAEVQVAGLSGKYEIIVGLYNPATGQRRLAVPSGADRVSLGNWQAP